VVESLPAFIPGLALCEAFYREAVRPVLDAHFPGLAHSAALIGDGSDVLGFDTPASRDHAWGPRLILLLTPDDGSRQRPLVHEALRLHLPTSFCGYPTHFAKSKSDGVPVMTPVDQGPVEHYVSIDTVEDYLRRELGIGPDDEPTVADWLTLNEQKLLGITAGKVFHDDLGLSVARERLAYYPRDVWIYLLESQWALIGQEEAFIGRTAQLGDELGSRVLAGRMVEKVMRLCFLMEKRYAPYSKWYGSGFQRLACAPRIAPHLAEAIVAQDYLGRERALVAAYESVAELHNTLGITSSIDPIVRTYSGWHRFFAGLPATRESDTRPHRVLFAPRYVSALRAEIRDPAVLAVRPNLGSVNQFLVESSDALQTVAFTRGLTDDLVP
jgi:hypothetical protein